MSYINSNPNTLVFIASSLAAIIAESQSIENVNILSSFFSSIANNLVLIAAQKQIYESELDRLKQIQDLKNQIKNLENDLC